MSEGVTHLFTKSPIEIELRSAMRELIRVYGEALDTDEELPVVAIVVDELQQAGVELPAALTML